MRTTVLFADTCPMADPLFHDTMGQTKVNAPILECIQLIREAIQVKYGIIFGTTVPFNFALRWDVLPAGIMLPCTNTPLINIVKDKLDMYFNDETNCIFLTVNDYF